MAVPIGQDGPAGTGRQVVAPGYFDGTGLTSPRTYDVSAEGHRFLVLKPAPSEDAPPPVRMAVVLNWFEELRRAVPSSR
jgi:hypothetical protein